MVGGIDMLDAGERIRSGEEQIRSFSDIAVLCRTNRQVEEMEEFLKIEGIPYTVTGKGSFLEAETVQRALKFFRALYGNGTGDSPEEESWDQALLEAYRPLKKKRPAALVENGAGTWDWPGMRRWKSFRPWLSSIKPWRNFYTCWILERKET